MASTPSHAVVALPFGLSPGRAGAGLALLVVALAVCAAMQVRQARR